MAWIVCHGTAVIELIMGHGTAWIMEPHRQTGEHEVTSYKSFADQSGRCEGWAGWAGPVGGRSPAPTGPATASAAHKRYLESSLIDLQAIYLQARTAKTLGGHIKNG